MADDKKTEPTDDGRPEPKRDDPPKPDSGEDTKLSQADVDRIVEERLARERRKAAEKYGDYDELKKQAAEATKLKQERETENEKAVREAREQGASEALAKLRPQLVLAEMRAAAAGRIAPDRLDDLTDDIDLGRYIGDDGKVDLDRVRRKVDAWAPKPDDGKHEQEHGPQGSQHRGQGQQPTRPKPDPSQGGRPSTSDGTRGAEEAKRRFGDRAVAPRQ